MKKNLVRYSIGFVFGLITATAVLGYVFAKTTISYRSTFFAGRTVLVNNSGIQTLPARHYDAARLASQ